LLFQKKFFNAIFDNILGFKTNSFEDEYSGGTSFEYDEGITAENVCGGELSVDFLLDNATLIFLFTALLNHITPSFLLRFIPKIILHSKFVVVIPFLLLSISSFVYCMRSILLHIFKQKKVLFRLGLIMRFFLLSLRKDSSNTPIGVFLNRFVA